MGGLETLLTTASNRFEDFAGELSNRTREEKCAIKLTRGDLALALGRVSRLNSKTEEAKSKLAEATGIYSEINKTCLSDKDFLARNNNRLGIALAIRGQLTENATLLQGATGAFDESLKHPPDSREKAATQNNRGLALAEVARLENDTKLYRDAKGAFVEALELGKQDSHGFDAAPVRNNLGNVLVALGRREHDAAQLKRAMHEYCAALKKWTSEGESCHWAAAQNNLCWTLLNIAKMEHDQNQLERIEPDQNQIKQLNLAICSCLNALKEWPRGSWDRPITHDNLGLAYTKRGELENDTASLNQGVNAHRCALEELEKLTPDRPRRRADAKRNLGTALVALGNRTGDTKLLEQALTDFDQALQYYKGLDKLNADDVRGKILEVEGRLAQPQGGSSSPAPASEPSPSQPATPDSPTCEFSQSPCEDACLALGSNSKR
ncbi:MAG TPA: tetratricopeptide repeat protein [Terriglobia bacterium]|nr:tetratricopeptide repeat protein [Terriglobia bacterium]